MKFVLMKSLLPWEGVEGTQNDTTYKNFTTNCFLCSSAVPRSLDRWPLALVVSPSGRKENLAQTVRLAERWGKKPLW